MVLVGMEENLCWNKSKLNKHLLLHPVSYGGPSDASGNSQAGEKVHPWASELRLKPQVLFFCGTYF